MRKFQSLESLAREIKALNEKIIRLPSGRFKAITAKGKVLGIFNTREEAIRMLQLNEGSMNEGPKNLEAQNQDVEASNDSSPQKQVGQPQPQKKPPQPKKNSPEPSGDKVKLGQTTPIILKPTTKDTEYKTDSQVDNNPGKSISKAVVESIEESAKEWEKTLTSSGYRKDENLYKKEFNTFHHGDYGYFKVGSKVKTPEIYKGVHEGTIVHAYHNKNESGDGYKYIVKHVLPKGHSDAVDSNGEPEHTKHNMYRGADLSKHNPPIKEEIFNENVYGKKLSKSEKAEQDKAFIDVIGKAVAKGKSITGPNGEKITPDSWKTHDLNPNKEAPKPSKPRMVAKGGTLVPKTQDDAHKIATSGLNLHKTIMATISKAPAGTGGGSTLPPSTPKVATPSTPVTHQLPVPAKNNLPAKTPAAKPPKPPAPVKVAKPRVVLKKRGFLSRAIRRTGNVLLAAARNRSLIGAAMKPISPKKVVEDMQLDEMKGKGALPGIQDRLRKSIQDSSRKQTHVIPASRKKESTYSPKNKEQAKTHDQFNRTSNLRHILTLRRELKNDRLHPTHRASLEGEKKATWDHVKKLRKQVKEETINRVVNTLLGGSNVK